MYRKSGENEKQSVTRSGNDVNMVSYWLGYVDINTTHIYLEINMEMKRKMIASSRAEELR